MEYTYLTNSINLVEYIRSRVTVMFTNRVRHLTAAALPNRLATGCSEAFVPVAVPAGYVALVQEVYRLAAEQTLAQLAPPRHLRPTLFSAN